MSMAVAILMAFGTSQNANASSLNHIDAQLDLALQRTNQIRQDTVMPALANLRYVHHLNQASELADDVEKYNFDLMEECLLKKCQYDQCVHENNFKMENVKELFKTNWQTITTKHNRDDVVMMVSVEQLQDQVQEEMKSAL